MEKNILIVDDEKDWVQMLTMRLEHAGYQIAVAFDGVQALAQTVRLKPDLILLDLMMPAGGGLGALKNMRATVKAFSIPIIVVTAKGDKETKETAEKLGISGYFVKPVNMAELLAKIKEVLREKPAGFELKRKGNSG